MKGYPAFAPDRQSSGPGPQMFPFHIFLSIQDQRGQAQGQVDQQKAHREGGKARPFDAGVIPEVQPAADPAEDDVPKAEAQPQQGKLIPAVHAVDGKGASPRQAVAPAFHTVCGLDGVFQAPGHQNGQDGDPVFYPLNDAAVGHIPPDALLGGANGFQLSGKLGDKPEGHAQDQAQGGDDPPEEVHELVRGHDLIVAGEPLHHAHQHGGGGHAVDKALQGDGVIVGGIAQDGDALMVEGRIQDRRQDHHGQ